ncbi:MAG: hypothetical protein LBT59_08475 [Clostridiales bacterium]|nr:hypothetical protein [Clostridiales bacterium]
MGLLVGSLLLALAWANSFLVISVIFNKKDSFWAQLAMSFIGGCVVFGVFSYLLDLALYKHTSTTWIWIGFLGIAFLAQRPWRRKIELGSIKKSLFYALILLFSFLFHFHSLRISGGDIAINNPYTDIAYHHAYVRTIGSGANFPVSYPYFAHHPMGYHFMFDYVAAKLHQAGMHSVIALNVMSSLGLFCFLVMVSELCQLLFNSFGTGILACGFVMFHGSLALFRMLAEGRAGELVSLWSPSGRGGWLHFTTLEAWGLFNTAVLTNQRHFPFAMAFVVMIVYVCYDAGISLSKGRSARSENARSAKYAIFLAIMLGLMPYFNAVADVAAIMLAGLFSLRELALGKKSAFRALFFGALAGAILAFPQILHFSSSAEALSGYPRIKIGFEAGGSVSDIVGYYIHNIGIKLFLYGLAFFVIEKRWRADLAIFLVPILIANVLQLGVVLYDNNKLMWISLTFMNIFCARVLARFWEKLKSLGWGRAAIGIPAFLAFLCMASGFSDFWSVSLANKARILMKDESSQLKSWIVGNTPKDAVFMSHYRYPFADTPIATVSLAGRMLYNVSSCVDGSVDCRPRVSLAALVFSGDIEKDMARQILAKEKVGYVLLESEAIKEFNANEDFLASAFELVYDDESAKIYKVRA